MDKQHLSTMVQLLFTTIPPVPWRLRLVSQALFETADPRSFVAITPCAIFHVIVNRRNVDAEDKKKNPPEDRWKLAD